MIPVYTITEKGIKDLESSKDELMYANANEYALLSLLNYAGSTPLKLNSSNEKIINRLVGKGFVEVHGGGGY